MKTAIIAALSCALLASNAAVAGECPRGKAATSMTPMGARTYPSDHDSVMSLFAVDIEGTLAMPLKEAMKEHDVSRPALSVFYADRAPRVVTAKGMESLYSHQCVVFNAMSSPSFSSESADVLEGRAAGTSGGSAPPVKLCFPSDQVGQGKLLVGIGRSRTSGGAIDASKVHFKLSAKHWTTGEELALLDTRNNAGCPEYVFLP